MQSWTITRDECERLGSFEGLLYRDYVKITTPGFGQLRYSWLTHQNQREAASYNIRLFSTQLFLISASQAYMYIRVGTKQVRVHHLQPNPHFAERTQPRTFLVKWLGPRDRVPQPLTADYTYQQLSGEVTLLETIQHSPAVLFRPIFCLRDVPLPRSNCSFSTSSPLVGCLQFGHHFPPLQVTVTQRHGHKSGDTRGSLLRSAHCIALSQSSNATKNDD